MNGGGNMRARLRTTTEIRKRLMENLDVIVHGETQVLLWNMGTQEMFLFEIALGSSGVVVG